MEQLSEVEPEIAVEVKRIDGGSEVTGYLRELGIEEGTKLRVIALEPVHVHAGPISVKTGGKEAVLARGWADKVYVAKEGEMLPLLTLEEGEKALIKSIEGGETFEDWISELGVKIGTEVEFIGHLPDVILVFEVDGAEISMGEGQASKVVAEKAGKSVQLNYLKEGEKVKISEIIGGRSLKEKFEQLGMAEGKEITLVRKEIVVPSPKQGKYVLAKIGEQFATIGRGLAEKVWVE
ncbi:MAG: FeoA domain-containing protein [Euryarchaeota archaeon]|nr:FeoA domain-containing protein [Euryarchaeota archaeon]